MQDLNDKTTGGTLTAAQWNEVPSEIQNVIEGLGITLSGGDLNQLGKAIAGYVSNGNFYTDSGGANAYVLNIIGLKQRAPAYTDGFFASFTAGNVNTGASTVNVSTLGVKNIKLSDGTNPVAGDISGRVELAFDTAADNFVLLNPKVTDKLHIFDTKAAMFASTVLVPGMRAAILGYITIGDGGNNSFKIVAAATGTDDGGSFIDLVTHQAQGLFPSGVINNKQFGAAVDGATDDLTENQAAIDFVELTNATLNIAAGISMVSAPLNIQKSISLLGTGRQSQTTATNPASGSSIIKASGAFADILKIRSATSAEFIYGLTIRDLVIDGNNLATSGITGDTIAYCTIENVLALRCTGQGLQLTDDNGNISLHNRILGYEYNATANAASAGSHGIFLKDASGGGVQKGIVQTYIENVQTFTKNGNGIFMRGCDNNVVTKFQGFIDAGGTGVSLLFGNGLSVNARNNKVDYISGTIKAENLTHGNRVTHLISEGATIDIDAGGQLHYEIVDNVNAELFKTRSFIMSDIFNISATGMFPDGTVATQGLNVSQWGVIKFPDTATGFATTSVPYNTDWEKGNLVSLRFRYSTTTANTSADIRIRVRLLTQGNAGTPAAALEVDQIFTVAISDAAPQIAEVTLVFASPVVYLADDVVLVRVQREPLDAADTANGGIDLYGIALNYESLGPDSAGSGPFDIPPTGV